MTTPVDVAAEQRPNDRSGLDPVGHQAETRLRVLSRMIAGDLLSRAIGVAVHLRFADLLADGPRSAAELAEATGADAPSVHRFLRYLGAFAVFDDLGGGWFALNDLSTLLRHDVEGSQAGWVELTSGLAGLPFAGTLHAAMTGECAFDHVHKATFYEYLAGHPDLEVSWNAAMAGRAAHLGADLVDLIDWTGVATAVDVGGSTGVLLGALLRRRPAVTGTVFEQPHVVPAAEDELRRAGLAHRATAVGGDFFLSIPGGADLYLLANVIGNWPDDQAAVILLNCRDAMGHAARMVICEPILPDVRGFHPAKTLDLLNFTMFGGRTRALDEWIELLSSCGLAIARVRHSDMDWSVIEVVAG